MHVWTNTLPRSLGLQLQDWSNQYDISIQTPAAGLLGSRARHNTALWVPGGPRLSFWPWPDPIRSEPDWVDWCLCAGWGTSRHEQSLRPCWPLVRQESIWLQAKASGRTASWLAHAAFCMWRIKQALFSRIISERDLTWFSGHILGVHTCCDHHLHETHSRFLAVWINMESKEKSCSTRFL